MAETLVDYNSDEQGLDCVVCHEAYRDPRALPCGHSYCGPPRVFLKSLEIERNKMTCAICRSNFDLNAEDIKPLYGIRDYFDVPERHTKTLRCECHPIMDCKLWCLKCNVAICDDCIEMDHDGHPVRNLRKHLLDVIEKKLDSSSYTDLESFVTDLEQLIERCDTQIKRFSSESLAVKEIMKNAESDKSKVQLYLDTFKNRVTKSKPNLAVLLEMSTIDFTQCAISDNLQFQHLSFIQNEKTSVSVQTDKTTQTSVENLSISSTSTSECGEIRSRLEQYEDKLVKLETKSWYFRMKIEERRPLQIGPTYNFYFGNFRIELSANSLVPAKHDDVPAWWNDRFLHVNVKFHLIAANQTLQD